MHEPVLVLNANFEPINICTTRRAIGLLLAGKAGMVAFHTGISAPNGEADSGGTSI